METPIDGWGCVDDMLEDASALVLGSVRKGYSVNTCYELRLRFEHRGVEVEITVTAECPYTAGVYEFRLASRLDFHLVALRSRGEMHILLERVFEMADRLAAAEIL